MQDTVEIPNPKGIDGMSLQWVKMARIDATIETLQEYTFVLKILLLVLSAVSIIGGSNLLSTKPVLGGTLIFSGILLDFGVLLIYKWEIETVQDEIEDTQTEINQTKSEVNATKNEIAQTKEEVNATGEKVEGVQDSIYEKFGRYRGRDSLEGRTNELEEQIEDVEEELEELNDTLFSLSGRYRGRDSIEERIDELEETIESLKSELNDWEKEMGGKGRRFKRL
ncbi:MULTISPECIES: coiled-coil domain-containing protein [Halobaculum]|uniref:Uncharacterized protein n=2 Tax=Halobaculum TaxID=43927 RepID=A0A8T8WEJ5_9EURY|nr:MULTISPECIES: hypothetical protein [Halobaculum]QZP38275.1 hypothetical protein K6T50_03770 [Halobaculum magnesiiphilum]QZY03270.1 hypothetical protein K6T36_03605 [Halobaculum roseum]